MATDEWNRVRVRGVHFGHLKKEEDPTNDLSLWLETVSEVDACSKEQGAVGKKFIEVPSSLRLDIGNLPI